MDPAQWHSALNNPEFKEEYPPAPDTTKHHPQIHFVRSNSKPKPPNWLKRIFRCLLHF